MWFSALDREAFIVRDGRDVFIARGDYISESGELYRSPDGTEVSYVGDVVELHTLAREERAQLEEQARVEGLEVEALIDCVDWVPGDPRAFRALIDWDGSRWRLYDE